MSNHPVQQPLGILAARSLLRSIALPQRAAIQTSMVLLRRAGGVPPEDSLVRGAMVRAPPASAALYAADGATSAASSSSVDDERRNLIVGKRARGTSRLPQLVWQFGAELRRLR